jgi:hypothetical protein
MDFEITAPKEGQQAKWDEWLDSGLGTGGSGLGNSGLGTRGLGARNPGARGLGARNPGARGNACGPSDPSAQLRVIVSLPNDERGGASAEKRCSGLGARGSGLEGSGLGAFFTGGSLRRPLPGRPVFRELR